jgi:formiminotetrahydrofolate cyclodeaminase
MNEIKDKSVQVFIDELASKAATPGGGSAAAVMGAQAAALVSMVCNLTIGKPGYVEVEEEMRSLLAKSEALREQLLSFIQADVDVFDCLMATYRLPKDSEEDKVSRSVAIQAALQEATLVPLACAKACAEIIALSRIAAYKGNLGALSDAGVAVMAAYGGLKSAALNVYINTAGLKNKLFVEEQLAELEKILNGADLVTEEVYQIVKSKL